MPLSIVCLLCLFKYLEARCLIYVILMTEVGQLCIDVDASSLMDYL